MISSPSHFWSMDESLAQYKGNHVRRVCIKYKPNPYGFRVFVLNTRLGFAAHKILDFGLEQIQNQIGMSHDPNTNLTTSVCLGMSKYLRETWPNNSFTMITDRFYTSAAIASTCQAQYNVYCLGTIQLNRCPYDIRPYLAFCKRYTCNAKRPIFIKYNVFNPQNMIL